MDSIEGWSRNGTRERDVHSLWEHDRRDLRVRIAKAGDDIWDLLLQNRLIANRDCPDEAAERARRLMERIPQD